MLNPMRKAVTRHSLSRTPHLATISTLLTCCQTCVHCLHTMTCLPTYLPCPKIFKITECYSSICHPSPAPVPSYACPFQTQAYYPLLPAQALHRPLDALFAGRLSSESCFAPWWLLAPAVDALQSVQLRLDHPPKDRAQGGVNLAISIRCRFDTGSLFT